MARFIGYLLLLLVFSIGSFAQSVAPESIRINGKFWMVRNLNVEVFRNGDTIAHASSARAWDDAWRSRKPAWCFYESDPANGEKYGRLYNWYAVADSRAMCPAGWHVPSDKEWLALIDFIYAKDTGTSKKITLLWAGGSDDNGGNGLAVTAGGFRMLNAEYRAKGKVGYWWGSTSIDEDGARHYLLNAEDGVLTRTNYHKGNGFSVRCVRD